MMGHAFRFAFYDQIHTTGTDLKLSLDAIGAITLGKVIIFPIKPILKHQYLFIFV